MSWFYSTRPTPHCRRCRSRCTAHCTRARSWLGSRSGETHLIVSEDDAKTWRGTLTADRQINTQLFAQRGGTSVVEDSAGNVFFAGDQVYVYSRDGHAAGILEIPERPSSLAFGGPTNGRCSSERATPSTRSELPCQENSSTADKPHQPAGGNHCANEQRPAVNAVSHHAARR